jgi:anhydro-N-acetylmuramic acid kinase
LIKLHSTEEKRIIGLMSGTSLDGLDIACVVFPNKPSNRAFRLEHAETVPLPRDLLLELENIEELSAREVFQLNQRLGLFYAQSVNTFLSKFAIAPNSVDAIASHGQTVFHQPEKGFTVQLGCGATLAYGTGLPVINDFRSLDVAAGGQGAPLVPLGDQALFGHEAEAFLNIGGFANISFQKNGRVVAYDICPGNLPLNRFARVLGKAYDAGGEIASKHAADSSLLNTLNQLPYYASEGAKSLGTEWLENQFYPCFPQNIAAGTAIATVTQHLAEQLASTLQKHELQSVYVTGGGAMNTYLMEELKKRYAGTVVIPSAQLLEFKEAIVFAYLGKRFLDQKYNCLSSVTGAKENVCGGRLYFPR